MFEKVNPSHPDKIAGRIAGAIVDLAYAAEADPKIAVEVLIGHGVCHVKITTDHILVCRDERFEIFSVEDVKGKGMYTEVLAVKIKPTKGA